MESLCVPRGLRPTRCQSLVATGQLDEAEQRLETTLAAACWADMPHSEGMALKVRGQLHAARGDQDAARQDFGAAIAIFEELGSQLELGGTSVVVRAACHGVARRAKPDPARTSGGWVASVPVPDGRRPLL